jgi:hypothetical protein
MRFWTGVACTALPVRVSMIVLAFRKAVQEGDADYAQLPILKLTCRYDQYSDAWDTSVVINVMGEDVRFFHAKKKGVDRVFVDHPIFLAKVRTHFGIFNTETGCRARCIFSTHLNPLKVCLRMIFQNRVGRN